MEKLKIIGIILMIALLICILPSCEKWAKEVDPLISQIEDENLDDESTLEFQLIGLLGRMGGSGEWGGMNHILYRISGFGDEYMHLSGAPGAGAPDHITFVQDMPMDLDFVVGDWTNAHEIRWMADRLVKRVEDIGQITDADLKSACLWWGNMLGGIMRMYLGEHWCLTKGGDPGAVITTIAQYDAGEFGAWQTMAQVHELARAKFTAAQNWDPGDYEGVDPGTGDRVANSFIARTYLFDGNYAQAKTFAEQGLQEGDTPFHIYCDYQYYNSWWASVGRYAGWWNTWSVPGRFLQYVLDDRLEGEIITEMEADEDPNNLTNSLRGYEGDGLGHKDADDPRSEVANPDERLPLWERGIRGGEALAYQNDRFQREDIFPIIDWREMELILAEVAIDAGDIGTAVTHINNVREYHGLDPYTIDDMNNYDNEKGGASTMYWPDFYGRNSVHNTNITGPLGLLIEERDKTLWMKGTRIVDQTRFDLWHMESTTWRLLPVPLEERIKNPNISADL